MGASTCLLALLRIDHKPVVNNSAQSREHKHRQVEPPGTVELNEGSFGNARESLRKAGSPIDPAGVEGSNPHIESVVEEAHLDSNSAAVPPDLGSTKTISNPGWSSKTVGERFKEKYDPSVGRSGK